MLHLKENPTMKDFQKYIYDMEIERNFIHETTLQNCLLLGEEVGELFRAVRKLEGIKVAPESKSRNVGEEMADIFIYLCAIANRNKVDLEQAFRDKEEKNKKRVWK